MFASALEEIKMIRYLFSFIILLLLSPDFSISQTNAEIGYGFQGDITTSILQGKISGSLDLDLVNFSKTLYLGTRLSAEHYSKSHLGNKNYDSPYTDLDALAKITLSTKYVEVNLCPGISHHSTKIDLAYQAFIASTGKIYIDYSGWYGKFSGDVKLKIYRDYFGFLLKFSGSKESSVGFGLFFGGNSRHP